MFRVKPILSFVAVAALLVAVGVAGVDAGNLKGKKLLVDTVFNMMEAAEKVNEGVNTIAPSMSMAGDTVKVELFIDGGGGENIVAGGAKFADSDMEMMFDESWKIVAVDGIVPVLGAVGIKDDEFTLGGLTAVAIPDNGYFATVKILAQADIPDGASFYVKHAIILTATFERDSLDVSEAIVTVETPKGPTIVGMGDDLMEENVLQIPRMGGSVSVTVGLDNAPGDATISYTVATQGEGSLSVLDPDGMMLELDEHMMVSADKIVLKVTGGDLQVTVKATVNGEDTAPATFTFTQLNPATFSLSLDGNPAAGDQALTTLDVTSGSEVPIQLFINDIRGANGFSARFEYDAAQVGYEEFARGGILPNAQVLEVAGANPTAIDISVVSFGGQATVDSGLLGSVRFRTTDAFSGTTLRMVSAEIGRGDQREKLTLSDTGVMLRLAQLTPDFNGDGKVDFGDFVAFGMHFGASRGDARYEAKYDLDEDGAIGFGDFLIFGREFGT